MSREVMVDIETLDTRPSSVVLSVAAVEFNVLSSYEGHAYVVLDTAEQLGLGRTVSQSTLLWWMNQSDEARGEAFTAAGHRRSVGNGLSMLAPLLSRADRVWAKGPQFDLVILESLYESVGQSHPWSYRAARDVRTMQDAVGPDWSPQHELPMFADLPAHHPLYDCMWQIEMVRAARARTGMN